MASSGQAPASLCVIGAADAGRLVQIKDVIPSRTLVSVCGTVTAVSEIVRINKDCVFLIDLEDKIKLVVKQHQFHKWHQQLVIGCSFVFTNLRLTTLSKAHTPQQRVFVPWVGSRLLHENADTSHLTRLSLKDWLATLGLSLPLVTEEHDDDIDPSCHGNLECTSYQGQVTDISLSDCGIIELDSEVSLYLCFVPPLQQPKVMDTGDVVTVHNVHHSLAPRTGKQELYCCMRSSIHVDHKNKGGETDSDGSVLPLISLLSQYAFTHRDLPPLLQLNTDVSQVFSQQNASNCSEVKARVKGAFNTLLNPVLKHGNGRIMRNYLLEFCQHQQLCPLNRPEEEAGTAVPQITLLRHLTDAGNKTRELDAQGTAGGGHLSASSSGEEEGMWRHEALHSADMHQQPVVGWLTIHRSTGRLQLCDGQAAVDVVVTCQPTAASTTPEQQSGQHQYYSSCTGSHVQVQHCKWLCQDQGKHTSPDLRQHPCEHPCQNPSQHPCQNPSQHPCQSPSQRHSQHPYQSPSQHPSQHPYQSPSHHPCQHPCHCLQHCAGHHPPCPFVQPCCLGQTVIVNHYTLVRETFMEDGKCGGSVGNQKDKDWLYLVVPAEDCTFVHSSRCMTGTKQKKGDSRQDNSSCRKYGKAKACAIDRTEGSDRFVYITRKHHLSVQSIGSHTSQLEFFAEGFVISPEDSHFSHSDEFLKHGEQCYQKKRARLNSNSTKRQRDCCEDNDNANMESSSTSEGSCPCHHPVSVKFGEGSFHWFEMIQPPGLYRFQGTGETTPLQWPQMDRNLQSAMQRAGTRVTVMVSPTAAVQRVLDHCSCCSQFGERLTVPSLQSACSAGSDQLQSFRGVVIWRRHPPPQLPNLLVLGQGGRRRQRQRDDHAGCLSTVLGQRCLCVGVRDEQDPSVTASVYFNTASLVYPLALIPGSTVDFSGLERRTSKANKTYFNFLPVSSLLVRCVSQHGAAQLKVTCKDTSPAHWKDTPTLLLTDLWRQPKCSDVFVAECHICQFFRISLKSVCVDCGVLFQPSGCSAPACANTQRSRMVARVSVVVDDGSSQALVRLHQRSPPEAARKLLLLSPSQWQALETALHRHGELFLQKFGSRGATALEDLVSLLCDSAKVKRPCRMMLRRPMDYSKQSTDRGGDTPAYLSLTVGDVVERTINTGETKVTTLCLPYLQLDCEDVMEI